MNGVKDIQSLIQLIHSRDEVIVFPIGGEGQQLLDFLRYANFLHRICCIAAPKVAGNNTAQTFKHEVPVIPFEHLVHFRETAIFIVAGNEQYYQNLNAELTRYGCRMLVFVTNELHAQIRDALQRMANSGQIMMWFMNHFDRKINEMEYRIEEQNEISDIHKETFSEYRNAFRGKEVVILGNGPTLNYYQPIPDAIHIGLNRAWKREDIPLDYLFIIDGLGYRTSEIKVDEGFDNVREKIFVGRYPLRNGYNHASFSESFLMGNQKLSLYFVEDHSFKQSIYQNISHHPLIDFRTVSFNAIHFALFTNPSKIFLVGCDTSFSGQHFYNTSDNSNTIESDKFFSAIYPYWKIGYARTKMFARQYYPETEIISINPVGLRGLFKDVYTDEYQALIEKGTGGGQDKR